MEWHHFEYFKTLAETEHVTLAAKQLAVSQSALSRAILKLEEELDVQLFDRRGRHIYLNAFGKEFLHYTNRILYEMNEAKVRLKEMAGVETGTVTLGFLHTVGSTYLSNFIQQFKLKYPNVQIKLVQNNSRSLMELLQIGGIDICLTSVAKVDKPIKWEPFIVEPLFITLPATHPLANAAALSILELTNENFIVLKEGFTLRTISDEIFRALNMTPSISFEGEEILTISSFIEAGLGIALLPKIKYNTSMQNLVQIPIADQQITAERSIGICWNEECVQSKLMKEVRTSLRQYFSTIHLL